MRPLADVLRGTLEALGISRDVARAGAMQAWPAVARACIGAEEAARTRAVRVDGDTLVVSVPSPVLAQELRLRSEDVRAELARRVPDSSVRDVRFVPR